jgi:hypothetical protein
MLRILRNFAVVGSFFASVAAVALWTAGNHSSSRALLVRETRPVDGRIADWGLQAIAGTRGLYVTSV